MTQYLCELCGSITQQKAAPCGAEVCRDCCTVCYDADGFCEVFDAASETE